MSLDLNLVVSDVYSRKQKRTIPQRKLDYVKKLQKLLKEYKACLIVTVDHIGSRNIAEMRKDFRGRARFLFGKNTLIRKGIRDFMKETNNKGLFNLLNCVKGNCGLCFTNENVREIRREILNREKTHLPANEGDIAPCDVYVYRGPTGLEPTQCCFTGLLGVPTRINKGQIDIVDDILLVKEGNKVGLYEALFLKRLNIRPFHYEMKVISVYDNGIAYDASILDICNDEIGKSLCFALHNVAALCYSLNYPTIINAPHVLLNSYQQILSLGLSLQSYSWEQLETVKTVLKNSMQLSIS